MFPRVTPTAAVFLSFACSASLWAQDAAPAAEASLPELIRQLGAASYERREEAARQLAGIGNAAVPLLERAADDEDLEIRYRARRVIDRIEQLDHERRLQAFLEFEGTPPDDVLPGWGRYREAVGDGEKARELFVEMQRAERRLFQIVERGEPEASDEFEKRCAELQYAYAYSGVRRLPTGSVAAVLFLAAHPAVEQDDSTANRLSQFCTNNDFRQHIGSGPRAELLRRVLGTWVRSPISDDSVNQLHIRTYLAMRYDVREGLVPAKKLLEKGNADYRMQYAMLAIGKFGDEGDLPLLESRFDNERVLSTSRVRNKVNYTCQVRDVALAVALHLTDQKTGDYPFARLRKQPQYLYSLNSMGFANDEKRKEAFEKWRQWKAEHTGDAEKE